MQPLVSVNIATFNRAHLLPRCLESVIAQSYRNLEIVIVDDASPDQTEALISDYQQRYGSIKYIRHHSNRGLAQARNSALAICTGHYVAFMDDDDEWSDLEKIEKQVAILQADKNGTIGIVCSSVRLFSSKTEFFDKIIRKPANLTDTIFRGNGFIYTPTVMTTKDILLQVGGFDPKLARGIDSDFYRMCIVKHHYDVHFMPEITTNVHEYGTDRITSLTTRVALEKHLDGNLYALKKFKYQYLKRPRPLAARLRNIISAYIKMRRI
jgi:glycosyltransferase involved in cell wall biosynthesis